ncbi:RNA-binding protein NOB1 [Ananas comosus]|uniref:RNA-binding protein NOB1 n=1 Tax=Ananas comosus TaxID=4615 RepID=A0A199W4H0_ANACO|nr:RNA-binding protein NOB1 [Ananas comosus]
MDPSPEFIKKVVKFARETGDLHTLSDVDIKIIALAYMLEAQIHGTSHLREQPPPLRVVNVKNLAEADMPGWGSNVPNLAEWEALEQISEGGENHGSRILPLKDLNNQAIPASNSAPSTDEHDGGHRNLGRPGLFTAPKKEVKIEGKKMVADGIDASQGEDTENSNDWLPSVSRSTHRRFLRRKARRELLASRETSELGECESREEKSCDERHAEHDVPVEDKIEKLNISDEEEENELNVVESGLGHVDPAGEGDDNITCDEELDGVEISSQTDESTATSLMDDGSSEQSWMLRSLSDSTVACVTSDYAMQNVILQIGLRLLAPGGMQIRQLHRWVLKCHACNKVTQEIGRIFCPKCGNGGTLRKVSVTVGENGIVLAARKQRFILRGTKPLITVIFYAQFSLPLPQGGREAITKNLILREDQLPHKLLYPKSKKKSSKQDLEFLGADDIFSHAGERRAPLKPPVRQALALYGGKRNPNDNHYSRRKH